MDIIKTTRPGHIVPIPDGVKVVGIVVFEGTVIVATERAVFRLLGEKLVPIPFADAPVAQEARPCA